MLHIDETVTNRSCQETIRVSRTGKRPSEEVIKTHKTSTSWSVRNRDGDPDACAFGVWVDTHTTTKNTSLDIVCELQNASYQKTVSKLDDMICLLLSKYQITFSSQRDGYGSFTFKTKSLPTGFTETALPIIREIRELLEDISLS